MKTNRVSKEAGPPQPMWTKYRVRFEFLERLYGSVPADPALIETWLRSRMPKTKPPEARSIADIQEEVVRSVLETAEEPSEETQYAVLVFQSHNGGLALRSDTFRAHVKDCARTLSIQYIGRLEGEAAFSTRVNRGVYQDPSIPWVPIVRPNGEVVQGPDGYEDRSVHARGPKGPINALKRIAYILAPICEWNVLVLADSVNQGDLESILQYGGVHGYGGERSRDGGKYLATVTRVEN